MRNLQSLISITLISISLLLTACASAVKADDSAVATGVAQIVATLTASAPTPATILTAAPTSTEAALPTAQPTATPASGGDPLDEESEAQPPTPTETPSPLETTPALPTVDPATLPLPPSGVIGSDHFLMGLPVGGNGNNFASSGYKYGSTYGGRLATHHGNDIGDPTGTPLVAVAPGTIYWAGNDFTTVFGAYANFDGNLVVLELDQTWEGRAVYALYGHLSEVTVQAGQHVEAGDVVGRVGATGIALGPHLHLEVRLDDPVSYWATRNPDLWVAPLSGTGVLAGRVINAQGQYLPGMRVGMMCADGAHRFADTYWDSGVNPDDGYGENFAIGNLPAGICRVEVRFGETTAQQAVQIIAGQTTFIVITR